MPLKVLIVEDDPAGLELMAEVLASVETEVHPVNDSEYAAALVQKERFGGIFLDLQMPKLHGFELACRIRQSSWNRSTPIIVVTGREEPRTMQQAFDVGATFFLQKPINRQKLLRLFKTSRASMFENRRRFVRVPLKATIACEVGSRITQGTTWNISIGGILIEAPGLHLRDHVKMSFSLPATAKTMDLTGVVVRVDERQRVGVQFTDISSVARERIRGLVDRVAKEAVEVRS